GHVTGVQTCALPILMTTSLSVTPTAVAPGSAVTLSKWTVRNAGLRGVGSFRNGFYLSTDAIITTQDTRLGGNTNSQLGALQSYEIGRASCREREMIR